MLRFWDEIGVAKRSSLADSWEGRRGMRERSEKGIAYPRYLETGTWTLKERMPVVYRSGDQRDLGRAQ